MIETIGAIPLLGPLLTILIPFIFVLGIVVTVHEYGHYIVGRWSGIRAEVFSVGYGKPIWSRVDKRGTVWQIALLPLGGYVKFLGDADGSSRVDADAMADMSDQDRAESFHAASVGRRAATVVAGPVFNFILSALVFAGLALYQGKLSEAPTVGELKIAQADGQDLRVGDEIIEMNGAPISDFQGVYAALEEMETKGPVDMRVLRDGQEVAIVAPYLLPPLVSGVQPLSPAANACVKSGDLFVSINDKPLQSFSDLKDIVLASEAEELSVATLRNGEEIELRITPQITDTPTADGGFEKRVMIGVAGQLAFDPATVSRGPLDALWTGVERVWNIITTTINGLKHMIFGSLSANNLQGPVGIAQVSGAMASQGGLQIIQWVAIISTAIGLLNLFPIPVLDGGHLVIFGYEAVTGKQPNEKILQGAMALGLSMLLMLMMFATYNDVWRIVNQPATTC